MSKPTSYIAMKNLSESASELVIIPKLSVITLFYWLLSPNLLVITPNLLVIIPKLLVTIPYMLWICIPNLSPINSTSSPSTSDGVCGTEVTWHGECLERVDLGPVGGVKLDPSFLCRKNC